MFAKVIGFCNILSAMLAFICYCPHGPSKHIKTNTSIQHSDKCQLRRGKKEQQMNWQKSNALMWRGPMLKESILVSLYPQPFYKMCWYCAAPSLLHCPCLT